MVGSDRQCPLEVGENHHGSYRARPFVQSAVQRLAGTALGMLGSLIFQCWMAVAGECLLIVNRLGMELLLYGFLFGMTAVIQFQLRAQQTPCSPFLAKATLEAHLQALQMQLEPHFLFNTLNAITTLVELGRQQKAAAEMLHHLNSILKSTLTRKTPQKVPLSQELELVENYLAIEQVRFADRLRVQIRYRPGARLTAWFLVFCCNPLWRMRSVTVSQIVRAKVWWRHRPRAMGIFCTCWYGIPDRDEFRAQT